MIAVYWGVKGFYRRRADGVEDESMGELMVKRRLGAQEMGERGAGCSRMVGFATGTSSRLVRLRFVLLGSFGEAFDPRPRSNAGGCRRQLANGILYNNVVDAQRIQVIMCRYSSTWTERPSQTPMCVAVLRNLEAAQPSRHLLLHGLPYSSSEPVLRCTMKYFVHHY
ncbi:hypothetical protein NA56DRAFT_137311 [Hyaloscypha hepaticicola]|uniref:Uncharacterized protein n=1 Tax=Hyaloscypha hepaticicola TaxID=2082293 RepID=A0A2J6QMN5_9HELO|nr:hypothetical protein NA56DRAFT_137311 [Hyaloscypha hepaticicola]